ncbi:MAG: hypothetical protein MJY71_02555 [Bacteroidaceae bacterium]|nr:hypothetical protein [Bacteroidaceae bacterium]
MEQNEKDRLQYMIDVMQAYKEGKEIEFRNCRGKWTSVGTPAWDWGDHEYRIKPEPPNPQYRPFESVEEVMEAIKEHGNWLRSIKEGYGVYNQIYSFDNSGIVTYACDASYDWALKIFVWADGTPFGKLIEE